MIRNGARDPGTTIPGRTTDTKEQSLEQTIAAMPLDALRDAKQLTQSQMAQLLKISQGAVSKVERRNDMFISTLRNYLRAIGGDLQIRAVFPEGDVLINQFREREPAAAQVQGMDHEGISVATGEFSVSSSSLEPAGPDTE